MAERSIEFDRLEKYEKTGRMTEAWTAGVVVSFKTRQLGYLQVRYIRSVDERVGLLPSVTFKSLPEEPSLQMLPEHEREYAQKVCLIVWRLVFDARCESVCYGT